MLVLVCGFSGCCPKFSSQPLAFDDGDRLQVSGILHKRVAFLVCDEKALNSRTKHVRKAEKFAVPIVSFSYVEECLKQVT